MNTQELLATTNACCNALSFLLLAAGFVAIKRGKRTLHRALMLGAFAASTLFLAGYLTRYALSDGPTHFAGAGAAKTVYLVVLFTHMPLAAVVVPLVLRALYLAFQGRFAEHRKVVRWLYPAWSYVSVTGVVVYLMLYQLYPQPKAAPLAQTQAAAETR